MPLPAAPPADPGWPGAGIPPPGMDADESLPDAPPGDGMPPLGVDEPLLGDG
jgi:hypothetical protein